MQRNQLLILANAYAQQLAERDDHFADILVAGQHCHRVDRLQRVIDKMRINLRHERLHFRFLLAALLGLHLPDQLADL
ncbi:hypothetical protein D3C73_1613120 [compost metagenome]